MVNTKFKADNSKFGKVLTQVIATYHINATSLCADSHISKGYFYALKRAPATSVSAPM